MPACLPEQLWWSFVGPAPSPMVPSSSSSSSAGAFARSARTAASCSGLGEMGGGGDREIELVEVRASSNERQGLKRLRGGPEERDVHRVAGLGDHRAVLDGHGMDLVSRLDDTSATDDYPERIHARRVRAGVARGRSMDPGPRRPRLDVAGAPGRPGAHRDAQDLRPAALRARGATVRRSEETRQVAALPDRRRRARAPDPPDERRPDPLPRVRREGPEDARRFDSGSRAAASSCSPRPARRSAPASGWRRRRRPRPSSPTSDRRRIDLDAAQLREILARGESTTPLVPSRPAGARRNRPRARERDLEPRGPRRRSR